MIRRTKLIVTIGPASMSENVINQLMALGVDAFRINFSHGSYSEKKVMVRRIRSLSEKHGLYIPIIGDLQGPVIRMRVRKNVYINRGETYRFTAENNDITIPYKEFYSTVEVGDTLLVDDGKLIFKVVKMEDRGIIVKALRDGILRDRKKVFIKGKSIYKNPLTSKDIKDIKFSIENRFEYIALSMTSSSEDIKILRDTLEEYNGDQWIIAKIESPDGVKNVRRIAEISDGLMIARGDLGQYFPLEKIPMIQKRIAYEGNRRGKITIIATQILESMIDSETPTRAEVTDIFNSVNENVDAILLTSETAVGRYPVSTVKWALKILSEADKIHSKEILYYDNRFIESIFDKFARGVIYMSHIIGGKIIGYTKGGNTARRIARYRPKKRVFIVTQDRHLANKINMLYAITPLYIESHGDYWSILEEAKNYLVEKGLLKKDEIIIYTIGVRPESTDMIKVESV